ncbi:hypothetical protein EKO29_17465 [Colwellia sp. Arc7-635]|jgi:hypothetical protein|uniref:hypothetical protein n=1 Tax=Colwellia sp. Arc7-635 TaxID=2497879 RepID=UPI000F85AD6D|nr:hypothetical protein [Colwellia sp. Arc7-635]AZQ85623.1 hypothetical protein EKO29_17465 [Colwellia sp. Arc7-635]
MSDSSTPETLSRFVKIDKWIFEVKSVRAIRVDDFGQPYSAIANFTLNGKSAYIDGLLTREDDDFTREDYATFEKVTRQLQVDSVNFDRFKQKRRVSDSIKVTPTNGLKPKLKLVK